MTAIGIFGSKGRMGQAIAAAIAAGLAMESAQRHARQQALRRRAAREDGT